MGLEIIIRGRHLGGGGGGGEVSVDMLLVWFSVRYFSSSDAQFCFSYIADHPNDRAVARKRAVSASHHQPLAYSVRDEHRRRRQRRHTCSAGGEVNGKTDSNLLSTIALPDQTLLASLGDVYKSLVVTEGEEEEEAEEEDCSDLRVPRRISKGNCSRRLLLAYIKGKSFPWRFHTPESSAETHPETESDREKEIGSVSVSEESERSWTLKSFCYECGRSAGIHLTECSGCRLVAFCSQSCRDECRKGGHRSECKDAQVAAAAVRSQCFTPGRRTSARSKECE